MLVQLEAMQEIGILEVEMVVGLSVRNWLHVASTRIDIDYGALSASFAFLAFQLVQLTEP